MGLRIQNGGELVDLGPNGAITVTGEATFVLRPEKNPVRVAVNTSSPTSIKNGDTVDGVTLSTGDRFLNFRSFSTDPSGIYVVGSTSSSRPNDAPAGKSALGARILIEEGSYRGKSFIQETPRNWDDDNLIWKINQEVTVDPPTGDPDTDRLNIQNAIDSLPDEGGTVLLQEGTYVINKAPNLDYGILLRRGVFLCGTSIDGCCLQTAESNMVVVKIGVRASLRNYDLSKAIHAYPGDDIQTLVDNNPEGTIFYIRAGTHREQKIIPKDGDIFLGEEGAILSGARVLSGWSYNGSQYEHTLSSNITMGLRTGDIVGSSGVQDSIANDYPGIHPEELFVYNSLTGTTTWLEQVTNIGNLASNRWYIDYNANPQKVYTYDNWSAAQYTVEFAVTPYAIGYDVISGKEGLYTPEIAPGDPIPSVPGDIPDPYSPTDFYAYKPRNVTVKNLIIEKYACPAQTGAIGYHRPGLDWIIEGNEARWNHGAGVKAKGAFIIRGNYLHDNGQQGLAIGDGNSEQQHGGDLEEWGWHGGYGGDGGLIEDNIVSLNRKAVVGINPRWEGGAGKLGQTFNLTYRNNFVYDNDGAAIWYDFCYGGNLIENNYVDSNTWEGIFVEISYATSSLPNTVQCNYVRYNGEAGTGSSPYDGANIHVANSPNVHVLQNTVVQSASYGHGIALSDYSWRNLLGNDIYGHGARIYQNHVTMLGGAGSYGYTGGDTDRDKSTFYHPATNQWKWNHYHVPNVSNLHWRWHTSPYTGSAPYLSFAGFQAAGADSQGKADTDTDYEPFLSNCPSYYRAGISNFKVKAVHSGVIGIRASHDEFFLELPPVFAQSVKTEDCNIGWLIGSWWSELHGCQSINCTQGIKFYDDGGTPPHASPDVRPTNICTALHCLVSGSNYSFFIRGIGNRIIGCTVTNISDGGYGIYIDTDQAYSNYIVGNNIETETRWESAVGIRVGTATRNVIEGNTFDLYNDSNCITYSNDTVRLTNQSMGNYNRQNSTLLQQAIMGDIAVGGGVRVGNSSSAVNGTIRFNGSNLQVYQSGAWRTIATS